MFYRRSGDLDYFCEMSTFNGALCAVTVGELFFTYVLMQGFFFIHLFTYVFISLVWLLNVYESSNYMLFFKINQYYYYLFISSGNMYTVFLYVVGFMLATEHTNVPLPLLLKYQVSSVRKKVRILASLFDSYSFIFVYFSVYLYVQMGCMGLRCLGERGRLCIFI